MITKEMLQLLRTDIDAALAAVGDKHNVVLHAGNASFSPLSATFKLEVSPRLADGTVIDAATAYLRQNYRLLGLAESHLAQVFKIGGMACTLHGFNSRSRGKPFVVKATDTGKRYIVTSLQVKQALGIKDWETEVRP